MKVHTGSGVTESIKEGLDRFGITSKQLESSSHDGQYFHLSVPEHLRHLYSLSDKFVSTTDPLHLAGTVDVHIRKEETFQCLVKHFGVCKEIYNKFNWGKNYKLMVETCPEIEKNMAQLINFQTQHTFCFNQSSA